MLTWQRQLQPWPLDFSPSSSPSANDRSVSVSSFGYDMPGVVSACSEVHGMQRVTDSWSLSIFYQTAAGAECWHSRMHTSRHGGMREFVILYVVTSYIDKLINKRHAKYIRYTYTNRLISILGNHTVYRAMQYNAIEMLRILSYISI